MKRVFAKLATMKKEQDFVVMRDNFGHYQVQSGKSIGRFDGKGRGILNTQGCYFHHLTVFGGVKAYLFPAEFVQECQELFMLPGEAIGVGVHYVGLTVGGDSTNLLKTHLALDNNFVTHNKVKIESGTMLYNIATQSYAPYDGTELTGSWRRRSPEDFTKFVEETIADDELASGILSDNV